MASYTKPLSIFLSISVLICSISSSEETTIDDGVITVDLIHRDSPSSPFYNPSETQFERRMNAFRLSIARSVHLGRHYTSTSTTPKILSSADSQITPDSGEYLMKIFIGTPPVEMAAVVDTGSDLTWTQCAPCQNCYDQKPPLYDSTKSKTFEKVSCESDQCKMIGNNVLECDKMKRCRYYVQYGDGSATNGEIAVGTLTLGETSGNNTVSAFPKVVFGCGNFNYGRFPESMSGIVGLGGGSSSIVRQLEKSIGSRFSYCLTSPDANVSSKISFGSDAVVRGPNVMSTPLKKGAADTFYTVTLKGISVGNTKLEYDNSDETTTGFGNMIIDSGTTLSIIPKSMYEELETVLVKEVKGVRVDDPRESNGLCYKSPENGEIDSPAIIAHFEGGVDLRLPQRSNFVEAAKGVVCLSLVAAGLYSPQPILGNIHQTNHLIGFDVENQKVDFLPTDCS